MDFHSLTRRELQALCKKNKIPANMTNVAMADSLKALQIVAGLEEFLNQSDSNPAQVCENDIPEPKISQSATRTSTQRKPLKASTQSSQPLARATRSTRKLVTAEFSLENKDANIPSTPAVKKKVQAASARKQVEKSAVQSAYNTRRSVRLLEKSMDQLTLKEKGRTEPVKMDKLDDVEEKKDHIMTELNNGDGEEHNASNDSEVKTNVVVEKKDDITEGKNGDEDDGVKTERIFVALDVKGKTSDDQNCESDSLLRENSGNPAYKNDAPVAEDLSKAGESNKNLVLEESNLNVSDAVVEGNCANEEASNGKEELSDEDPSEYESESDLDDVIVSEENYVSKGPRLPTEEICDRKSDENPSEDESKFELSTGGVCDGKEENFSEDDMQSEGQLEIKMKPTEVKSEFDSEEREIERESFEDDDDKTKTDEEEIKKHFEENTEPCEEDNKTESGDEDQWEKTETEFFYESENDEFVREQKVDAAALDQLDMLAEVKNLDSEESLIEVIVTQLENFTIAPISERHVGSQDLDGSENLFDVNIVPEMEFALAKDGTPTFLKQRLNHISLSSSGGKSTSRIALSPLSLVKKALADQIPQANRSTPMKSSASKKHMIYVSDINKENIDKSGMKVAEPKKDVKKKNVKSIGENIDTDISLRKLHKMLREKLNITNKAKNTEDKNVSKDSMGKARVALQTLSENRMPIVSEKAEE